MKETINSPSCERAPNLLGFLYHEMDERETREFQLHLQQCEQCREEVASFGAVRESIMAWRDEALAGFVSAPPVTTKANKSALTALRQFFDLSPLWLKGATALATVAFLILAGVVALRTRTPAPSSSTASNSGAKYTEQEVERMVKEALAKQALSDKAVETQRSTATVVLQPKPQKTKTSGSTQLAKSRRPLSRAERDQLAADLRLLSTPDDTQILLLGDRINQ